MAVTDWMPTLKAKVAEITEIKQVHSMDELPGTIIVFPSAIITVIGGTFDYSTGGPCLDFHTVQIAVYLAGQLLPEAYAQALPILQKMRDKLAGNIKLSALVDHILPAEGLTYEGPGSLRYGETEGMIGIVFRYTVKENVTGDFAVSA